MHPTRMSPASNRPETAVAGMAHPENGTTDYDVAVSCRVLVVDDDCQVRNVVARALEREGCDLAEADDGDAALERLRTSPYDVAIIDLRMPRWNGTSLIAAMKNEGIQAVPIIMSGYGDVQSAVEAIKQGAFDFVEKPDDIARLPDIVHRAYRHRRLQKYADEMAETAGQWEATFNSVPDLIAVVNTDAKVIRINRAFANRLGCAPNAVIGRGFNEIIPGADAHYESWGSCGSEMHHDSLSVLYGKVLGGVFMVTSTPLYGNQGRLVGYVYVARDVTRLKLAEDRVRAAHTDVQMLLGSLSYFVIGLNADSRITQWNAAAEHTFALTQAQALGMHLRDAGIRWDWTLIEGALQRFKSTQETTRLTDIRYTRPDASHGVLEITMNAMASARGDAIGIVLMGADITTRKDLEIQLMRAQKLEAIGQLASGIAHEINTPIQYVGDNLRFIHDGFKHIKSIRSAIFELLDHAYQCGFALKRVEAIRELAVDMDDEYLIDEIPKAIVESLDGIDRVAGILRAMKEFSHPGTVEKTLVDLNHAIESTITVARNEWKYVAEMITDFDQNLPLVACLPSEINQVILNMLINAVHAIKDAIDEQAGEKGTITVSTATVDDGVEIRIRDTGSGIPEAAREHVFDPFFTTKEVGRGTGQGLSIAHNVIVEKHSGSLSFETETGKGTTFIIRLPAE